MKKSLIITTKYKINLTKSPNSQSLNLRATSSEKSLINSSKHPRLFLPTIVTIVH